MTLASEPEGVVTAGGTATAGWDPYLGSIELAAKYERHELSPLEVTRWVLDRIDHLEPSLHAWALLLPEAALAQAARAERALMSGGSVGPLSGVPVGVKDNCYTESVVTTNGLALNDEFRPSYDATVVARLREAGAIILGKTQHPEGAFAEYRPDIVPPVNPWNKEYWPGGSSSGSAVATPPAPHASRRPSSRCSVACALRPCAVASMPRAGPAGTWRPTARG